MNTDEIRDWFAARDGWLKPGTVIQWTPHWATASPTWLRLKANGKYESAGHDVRIENGVMVHVPCCPYPNTIDGAASALPKGWTWRRYGSEGWRAFTTNDGLLQANTPDTGNEIDDRYLLAYNAAKAEEAQ